MSPPTFNNVNGEQDQPLADSLPPSSNAPTVGSSLPSSPPTFVPSSPTCSLSSHTTQGAVKIRPQDVDTSSETTEEVILSPTESESAQAAQAAQAEEDAKSARALQATQDVEASREKTTATRLRPDLKSFMTNTNFNDQVGEKYWDAVHTARVAEHRRQLAAEEKEKRDKAKKEQAKLAKEAARAARAAKPRAPRAKVTQANVSRVNVEMSPDTAAPLLTRSRAQRLAADNAPSAAANVPSAVEPSIFNANSSDVPEHAVTATPTVRKSARKSKKGKALARNNEIVMADAEAGPSNATDTLPAPAAAPPKIRLILKVSPPQSAKGDPAPQKAKSVVSDKAPAATRKRKAAEIEEVEQPKAKKEKRARTKEQVWGDYLKTVVKNKKDQFQDLPDAAIPGLGTAINTAVLEPYKFNKGREPTFGSAAGLHAKEVQLAKAVNLSFDEYRQQKRLAFIGYAAVRLEGRTQFKKSHIQAVCNIDGNKASYLYVAFHDKWGWMKPDGKVNVGMLGGLVLPGLNIASA